MLSGKVVGSLVSTVKDGALKGAKLLVVRLIENGRPGRLIIAADAVKVAGIGDHVFVVGGREAAMAMGTGLIPVDAAITGIIDKYNLNLEL
jgi:ethanolamine utilization protein EutN